jgi:hypothetical protein
MLTVVRVKLKSCAIFTGFAARENLLPHEVSEQAPADWSFFCVLVAFLDLVKSVLLLLFLWIYSFFMFSRSWAWVCFPSPTIESLGTPVQNSVEQVGGSVRQWLDECTTKHSQAFHSLTCPLAHSL